MCATRISQPPFCAPSLCDPIGWFGIQTGWLAIPLFPHLHRVVLMEDNLREKNQQLVELEVRANRLAQENKILEERNKFLLVHVQGSPTSPKERLKVSEAQ